MFQGLEKNSFICGPVPRGRGSCKVMLETEASGFGSMSQLPCPDKGAHRGFHGSMGQPPTRDSVDKATSPSTRAPLLADGLIVSTSAS